VITPAYTSFWQRNAPEKGIANIAAVRAVAVATVREIEVVLAVASKMVVK
jgi:hypothetical protein